MSNSKQQIIQQDNDLISHLVEQVEMAGQALDADRTDAAVDAYNGALIQLGLHMASFWKAGYRLCRGDSE